MNAKALRQMIDGMVADSIKRILPTVMNEVLLRTIASSGMLTEAPQRKKPGPKPGKRRPQQVRQVVERKAPPKRRPAITDLSELLDESAGAEFYGDPNAAEEPDEVEEVVERRPQVAARLQTLSPALRGLAENVSPIDDPDEMWEPGEHDSGQVVSAAPGEIRNIDRAAEEVGIDFSRMAQVAKKTAPVVVKESASDRLAKAQFETQRLERMREKLSKPVG